MNRRGLIFGLLAAPLVVRTPGILMPVKPLPQARRLDVLEVTVRYPPQNVQILMNGRVIGLMDYSTTLVNLGSDPVGRLLAGQMEEEAKRRLVPGLWDMEVRFT